MVNLSLSVIDINASKSALKQFVFHESELVLKNEQNIFVIAWQ